MISALTSSRYGRVAVALHWLVGTLLLAQIAFGFLLDELAPRGTPARAGVINLHKSLGIVLGALIVLRLAWRLAHRPPPMPLAMAPWQRAAALAGHRALYACMVVMPLSGYLASNVSKHGVRLFGLALRPWGPDLPALYAFLNGVHVATAWAFAALIVVHVAAALKHRLVDRDQVFVRMWPGAST
ncbi:MAG TPA: cytochrome b [Albitalea sp.]|nr:cytochrome b [Albitalea sp.]